MISDIIKLMPRPEKPRTVLSPPLIADFKPTAVQRSLLESVELSIDEYEALRLADYLGYEHEEAASHMAVSRPTFTRLIEKARKKTARFLVEGLNLKIEGGNVNFKENLFYCPQCRKAFSPPEAEEHQICPYCKSEHIVNLAQKYERRCCSGK